MSGGYTIIAVSKFIENFVSTVVAAVVVAVVGVVIFDVFVCCCQLYCFCCR